MDGLLSSKSHFRIVTLCFPAVFFLLIVLYMFLKDRFKQGL